MSPMGRLEPDAQEIAGFVHALFRYADESSYVSLRAFLQREVGPPPYIRGSEINGAGLDGIIDDAVAGARFAANYREPLVFAPPVATFRGEHKAAESDLTNALVISVELDSGNTIKARQFLEHLLGPATCVVASGGEWVDPETGEVFPKLHLHWRLSEPTRTPDEHSELKHARCLACALVQADPTATTSVHPLRWPGSWHMKGAPKLARSVTLDEEAEVHLVDAVEALEAAAEAAGLSSQGGIPPQPNGQPQAPIAVVRSALAALPNGDEHWDQWNKFGMAIYAATAGSAAGLDAWITWSQKSTKYVAGECDARWKHFHDSPPSKIGFGTIAFWARAAGWQRPSPDEDPRADVPPPEDESQRGIAWPEPLGFFLVQDNEPPELRPEHVPAAIWVFAKDVAERMGVDPTTVALSGLVSCASVINDAWCIQPRRLDTTWTENARLWGAIVGDPSVLKTPIISLCTRPVDRLDAEAREYHQNQMRHYKKQLGEWRKDKEVGEEPRPPKLSRYLVEGATVEALSEVLRDDDEARQQAPGGKVLARHDEMGELFGNLDRYNAGGRGGGDRGAYLRLFNGGRYTIDRIMRGSFAVPNWSACVLGGIQPAVIQKIARFTDDDGLLQRFLYAVPGYQLPGIDRKPDDAALERYQSLFPRLAALHPPRHPDGGRSVVILHAEAHKHREDTDAVARAMAALPDTSSRLRACFGKWAGQFARLCLTAHLIEYIDAVRAGTPRPHLEVVSEATARMVACLMRDVLLPHLLRADSVMFSSAQTGHAGWIAGHILANEMGRITTRDVVRAYGQLRSPEARGELAAVMASLVTVGWLEPMAPTNPAKPVSTWLVNPGVHTLFAEHARRHRDRQEKAREQVAADMEAVRSGRGATTPGDLP